MNARAVDGYTGVGRDNVCLAVVCDGLVGGSPFIGNSCGAVYPESFRHDSDGPDKPRIIQFVVQFAAALGLGSLIEAVDFLEEQGLDRGVQRQ